MGQPDMVSSIPNNAFSYGPHHRTSRLPVLCKVSNGVDANEQSHLSHLLQCHHAVPAIRASDGTRLFIADGGNDRMLEFLQIPIRTVPPRTRFWARLAARWIKPTDAADSLDTPVSMAFDGTNLYVGDPYNRRIMVFSPQPVNLPYQAVVNSANPNVYAGEHDHWRKHR